MVERQLRRRGIDDACVLRAMESIPREAFLPESERWSAIFSKKSLEANKGDFRRVPDYPGTGPYKFKEFNPRDKWAVEKNPDYWNKELPYVDRIERISIPCLMSAVVKPDHHLKSFTVAGP